MATARPLIALAFLVSAASAAAGPIELRATDGGETPKAEAPPPGPAAVDAPPVLPLFAGALAVLGWRLGRRRSR